MKRKNIMTTVVATVMALAMSMTAFAGEVGWTHNSKGWWYGTDEIGAQWYSDGWHWIDGNKDGVSECYYFGADGYILANTATPDGYTVNGDGAWTVDGVVQTQGTLVNNNNAAAETTQINNGDTTLNSDNGGYNSYGCSNAALELLKNSREDNAKYGEVKVEEYSVATGVTYANGFFVSYPKEGSGTYKKVQVASSRSDLNGSHLFSYYDSSLSPEEAAKMLQRNGFEKGVNGAYENGLSCWVNVGDGTINWDGKYIGLR